MVGAALGGLVLFCAMAGSAVAVEGHRSDLVNRKVLRVCADPANMPFSNDKKEGFENKIAEIISNELKVPVEYTWFPQAVGFTRNTLLAKRCDVIIGTGQGDDLVLNTNALYRSAYALIYKPGTGLDGVDSIFDPRLKGKKVGVVQGTPSATIVAKAGLMDKARPYRLMVDRRYDDPSADMVKDIRSGEIDAGVMWGPIAGYYGSRNGEKLIVVPLTNDVDKAGRLDFRITMGVRQGDDLWKRRLNDIIRKRQADIDKVLLEYGVPMIDEDSKLITSPRS
ncbi:MAG: substrate-binding domain-containing protein [Hyphomicrobium sp.]|uniref:substrate-binding domain-containing protein n=1 Tax=Hyphomicrobium sp. TaxID=82 RepID=UPI0013225B22|nr:substrate-binding domain-containing protein [Hyphomicrobium sp.]KAB2942056.1 MAG: quinoprotein dehydrogenase-associated putative ABC transporter substrate-binding protein [Hyphomicrobium sp.]MBZ0210578.1 substrate-binding domain-containing protein [Hyphomicrobium sp.]